MPMSRRERLAYKLRNRYHLRRIIFTLAIPAIIGMAIFGYSIFSGFAPVPLIGGASTQTTVSAANLALASQQARQTEFNALADQLQPGQNASSVTVSTTTLAHQPPNSHNFDLVLTVSLITALTPYSVDATLSGRRVRKYEQDFTDFLFELSELVRGGIDPIKATITLSQGGLGLITKPVQVVAKQMEIGFTFEQAMRNLATSLQSPLVDKYIDLVIQASYSGGAVANLIQRASADMSTFLNIEKEKRAGLSQYMLVLYAAQIILIVLSAIIVVQFLPNLKAITGLGSTNLAGSILGSSDINTVPLERDLYLLVIVNGFMGGLVIGKISEGKVKHGIKHGLILVLVGFVAWSLFVVPATSGATANYNVTWTTYGFQGTVGGTVPKPFVVTVTDPLGGSAATQLVLFTIAGPPGATGAKIIPSSIYTDTGGKATVAVILGSLAGPYTVTATVEHNSSSTIVTAAGLGGGG
jgi:flagellar protein FlaJ